MTAEKQHARSRWLFGVASLVLTALAIVALGGHVAAGPAGPAAAAPPPAPASVAATGTFTSTTTTLPLVVRNHSIARLAVDKQVFPASFVVGSQSMVTYTVTIQNVGGSPGTLLSIVDTLPPGFTFDSIAPGTDLPTPPTVAGGTVTWTGSWTMNPGDQIKLVYWVVPSLELGQHTNQVSVTASGAVVPAAPAEAAVTILSSVLLHEDFDTGIDAWTPFLNHHRLEPGQWYYGPSDGTGDSGALTHDCNTGTLIASDGLMMYLQPGAEQWTDYRVEADMFLTGGLSKDGIPQPEQGDPIGFWLRGEYQDSDLESQWVSGYYVVIVGHSTSTTHYVRISKMQQPGDCEACLKPYRMYNFDNPVEKAWSEPLPGPFEHYRWYHLAVEVRGANIKVFLDNELVLDWTDPLLPFLNGTIGLKTHETQVASFDNVTVTPLE